MFVYKHILIVVTRLEHASYRSIYCLCVLRPRNLSHTGSYIYIYIYSIDKLGIQIFIYYILFLNYLYHIKDMYSIHHFMYISCTFHIIYYEIYSPIKFMLSLCTSF